MAADIPTCEPTSIVAGDTVKWTRSLSDYSYADGWRLSYAIRGAKALDVVSAADTNGTSFAVTLSSQDSAKLVEGQYRFEGRVEYNGESWTIFRSTLVVEPNVKTAQAGDQTPFEEKALAFVEAAILYLEQNPQESYAIGGRSVTYRDIDKLYQRRAILKTRLGRQRGQAVPSREVVFRAAR